MPHRYKSIADLPGELPVFPLAGAILLPRATLPLNIFEPRYLRLFDDVMSAGRLVGIIQPSGEGGPTGSPQDRNAPLREVGCAGRVTAYQEHDDGRLTIALTGVARFRAVGERSVAQPYRVLAAEFEPFAADLEPGRGEDDVDRERLLETLKRYLAQRNLRADWSAIARTGVETLVNWLSVASPFGGPEKQALLEAGTLQERAEALMTLAEMELATSSGDGGGRLQ
ncbi:MAG: LON peptidase substrate-binding domain-containing protein [Hyphomicrobiaceae bacterium]|nr:LON peptidase substrate-binding domain-containing protein [Hyphomicrobiaceae bacterium]